MVAVRASREEGSAASMAMMRPRGGVGWGVWAEAGDVEVGGGGVRGGEILDKRRIFPRVGMERIMASRDLACVSMPMLLVVVVVLDGGFCNGARVREFSGWCWVLWGRGGGPIVKGLLMLGPMKSGRGRDWRRWPVGKAKGVVGLLGARTGAYEALVMRRRLGSGLLGEFWLGSGLLKRGEGCPAS